MLTVGVANTTVRSAEERNGFVAWAKLYQKHNPRTPARGLMALQDVVRPAVVKDIRLLGKVMEEWEMKVAALERDFGEKLSEQIKLAITLGMVQRDIQDLIYQGCEGSQPLKYVEVKDKIKRIISNMVQMNMPMPMDIGAIGGQFKEEVEEYEVDAVSGSTCHRFRGV